MYSQPIVFKRNFKIFEGFDKFLITENSLKEFAQSNIGAEDYLEKVDYIKEENCLQIFYFSVYDSVKDRKVLEEIFKNEFEGKVFKKILCSDIIMAYYNNSLSLEDFNSLITTKTNLLKDNENFKNFKNIYLSVGGENKGDDDIRHYLYLSYECDYKLNFEHWLSEFYNYNRLLNGYENQSEFFQTTKEFKKYIQDKINSSKNTEILKLEEFNKKINIE